ncbi:hypothetical protein [Salinicoccus carnicancri]|uniref:hypothetical protein n=1 Tax=Salinicoccus carnicancri TaxID=558170 RepID=UPI000311D165|nr:hypothetical protein [Salinicoccus carnicancri]
MIVKTVNSYDIHVYGQVLRVVGRSELEAGPDGFDVAELMLNEPRGSKYMNLLTFHENDNGSLEISIDSANGIENRGILVKSFLSSLVDRGRIAVRGSYSVDIEGEVVVYDHEGLEETPLYDVADDRGLYIVNGKRLKLAATGMILEIQNITGMKEEIENLNDGTYDYLVLHNDGKHTVANESNDILPYPIIEVVSLLDGISCGGRMTTLNGEDIKIQNGSFPHRYQLVANSQFYIDSTDIYREGFVIK